MHRFTTLIVTLSVAVAGVGVAMTPAAAQTDESVLEEMVGAASGIGAEALEHARFAYSYAKTAALERARAALGNDTDPEWSAVQKRDALHNRIDGNSTAYQSWINERVDASTDRSTIRIRLDNGTSQSDLFLVADMNNGSYENLRAVEQTDRTIGESCTLAGEAGANAPDELDLLYTESIEPGKNVSTAFTGRLAADYKNDVDCSFIDS